MKSQMDEDQRARLRAIEPDKSFIVKAPAGSGKTGLLVKRYLRLLSLAESPEEVVAITFTRKASTEMRNQIQDALESALTKKKPENKHEEDRIKFATDVLKQDKKKKWHLFDSPDRLRIQTIDGLSTFLTQRMPILAKFGAQPDVTEDAKYLYKLATTDTFNLFNEDKEFLHSINEIILHFGNNIPRIKNSVTKMLQTRDLWLRPVSTKYSQEKMKQDLVQLIESDLEMVATIFPSECKQELVKLLRYAAKNINGPVTKTSPISVFPDCGIDNLAYWYGISTLLLTQSGTWRKQFTKRDGFPVSGKAEKAKVKSLIEKLEKIDLLEKRLKKINDLPSADSLEIGWELIELAKKLLKTTAAQLEIIFSEYNLVDFTGVSQHAVNALGEDNCPTNLALALDYQIKHLLVDEVQDVSESQYRLLHRLTREWSVGDGRTLFLVGDPQQAIYRFRGAEVRFFLKIFKDGSLGNIPLEPLKISKNFRASSDLVNWVNDKFAKIFPEENLIEGAVPFINSIPTRLESKTCISHYSADGNKEEAKKIAEIIKEIKRIKSEKETIAILVRNRSHLVDILPALQVKKISFDAIDIHELSDEPVIQDLLSLTHAFLFHADRVAWLACLRAPWCGLTMKSLCILCEENKKETIWQCIGNKKLINELEKGEQERLRSFKLNMQIAIEQYGAPIRDIIEAFWYRLGGPATLKDQNKLQHAKDYFSLLEEVSKGETIVDLQELKRRIDQLHATFTSSPEESANPVQVMTMHKAKGLEFDYVILPGLNRQSGSSESPLLVTYSGSSLVAVKPRPGEKKSIYYFIDAINKREERNEYKRILYVAATRAMKQLHLVASNPDKPITGSSLSYLWPACKNDFIKNTDQKEKKSILKDKIPEQKMRRLRADWRLPKDSKAVPIWYPPIENQIEDNSEFVEFEWAGETIKNVGVVVHRTIQEIAEDGLDNWTKKRLISEERNFKKLLQQRGVPPHERSKAINYIIDALTNLLNDERGRWILSKEHNDQHNEYSVSGIVNSKLINGILDRTFIDKNGIRWVIDYKTSRHEGGGVDAFLDEQQQRYQPKLEQYAVLMEGLGEKNIKLGLYFPLLNGWREWEYQKK